MKLLLCFGLAASTLLLSQPLYANDDEKEKGGKDGGKHAAAPAAHGAPAPQSSARKAPAPHFAAAAQSQSIQKSAPVAQVRANNTRAALVAQTRSYAQPQRGAPTVGLAVSPNNNAAANAQNSRGAAASGPGNSGNAAAYSPPGSLSRGWNRGQHYSWNNHQYGWNNGTWVIIDGGGYGYPYGYNNGYNGGPGPGYGSQAMAASVQDRLARQGYYRGPDDGVIGEQTRDAIADYQNDHRLPVSGEIDGPLLQSLGLN